MNNDFKQVKKSLEGNKSGDWTEEGKKRSLGLFKLAAEKVPAYKDFLKNNRINHKNINSWDDFQEVPTVSKSNYLKKYPMEDLCWGGTLDKKAVVFTSTSGSTGEPIYFPRDKELDWQYSIMLESFLRNNPANEPTLVIIGFGLGVWIGGVITYEAFDILNQRGNYPVSIITPGINKGEIFKALKNLSPRFKTTVLVGYPPFIKDIIDESSEQGINLEKINLRLIFAAESFNEDFRQYLASKSGIKNQFLDTMNIYGSADIGAMASETPISILIRKLALNNVMLFKNIFGDIKKTPTLTQYNPLFINFESVNGELVLTGNNTMPLIRYAIGDNGGVDTYSGVIDKIKTAGFDIEAETKKLGINLDTLPQMPFVFVYERNDFSVTLYGLAIYPETIREVLLEDPINEYITGKLTLMTKFDENQDQYLEINLELSKGSKINEDIKNVILNKIIANLRLKNSEFKELHDNLKDRAKPNLVFWPAEDPTHFRPGVKQSWVKK